MGIGDFGCRLMDYLAKKSYRNLELIAVDTDIQALLNFQANKKILIGDQLLRGCGTLGDYSLGQKAAAKS